MRVERVVPGGEGLARLPDGRTVFVPGGLPGDRIRIDRLDDRGRWGRATAWTLAAPSPERRAPPCRHAERCGGCDWMGWSPEAQRRGKARIVVDAMRRTGGLEVLEPEVLHAGGEAGWRGRITLRVGRSGVGFLRRGSHEVVTIDRCMVATDAVNEGLAALVRLGPAPLRGVSTVELRSAPEGASITAVAEGPRRRRPPRGALRAIDRALGVADERPRWPFPGGWLEASTGAFTQVHDAANQLLVAEVCEAVAELDGVVVDACCGAGNFSLPLAAAGHRVLAFDVAGPAVEDLKHAAGMQGLAIECSVGSMESELGRLAAGAVDVVAVILDPPRRGAKESIPALLELAPARVVYVACDPVSLARDARTLLGTGAYGLTSLRCVDMFPNTHHVETVAVFDRIKARTG